MLSWVPNTKAELWELLYWMLYRQDGLPVTQPTMSKHCEESNVIDICQVVVNCHLHSLYVALGIPVVSIAL